MEKEKRFKNVKYICWMNACTGLQYTKAGLEQPTNEWAKLFHDTLKKQLGDSVCKECSKDDLKTQWKRGNLRCNNNVCNRWLEAIKAYLTSSSIEFDNSDIASLPTQPWECIKLYMHFGCKAVKDARDAEIGSILSLFMCNSLFRDLIGVKAEDIQKIRDIRNNIMHSETLELDKDHMEKYIDSMIDLLSHKSIADYQSCIDAISKLKELKSPNLAQKPVNEMDALIARVKAAENKIDETIHQLSDFITSVEERIPANLLLHIVMDTFIEVNYMKYNFMRFVVQNEIKNVDIENILSKEHILNIYDDLLRKYDVGDMDLTENMEDIISEISYIKTATEPVFRRTNVQKLTHRKDLNDHLHFALDNKDLSEAKRWLDNMCKLIEDDEQYPCKLVYPAYVKGDRWKPVFVVLSEKHSTDKQDSFEGWPIYRRRFDCVSREAAIVVNDDKVRQTSLTHDEYLHIKKAINSAKLHENHSNITIVSACSFKSKNFGTKLKLEKKACIVIHCLLKGYIPFDEELYPDELEGMPVDVREGYFQLGMNPNPSSKKESASGDLTTHNDVEQTEVDTEVTDQQYFQTLKTSDNQRSLKEGNQRNDWNKSLLMGTSIGNLEGGGFGTLGGFVTLEGGQLGALTCAHVVKRAGKIVQPLPEKTDNKQTKERCIFGEVINHVFDGGSVDRGAVDAAVVKITKREPKEGLFIWVTADQLRFAGFDPYSPPSFQEGTILRANEISSHRNVCVIKYGARTGLTKGVLSVDGVFAKKEKEILKDHSKGEEFMFFDNLEVFSILGPSIFFDYGDSGSLAFMSITDKLHCIGLCLGLTSYNSCIVTPIEKVLEQLNLQFKDFTARQ